MGLPKTGTSAIQLWLVDRQQDLARHGILFPADILPPHGNARILSEALHTPRDNRDDRQQDAAQAFARAIRKSDADTAILSAEYLEKVLLSRQRIRAVQRNIERAGGTWAIGTFFLRNPIDLLNSSYAQNVKFSAFDKDFHAYLDWRWEMKHNDFAGHITRLRGEGIDARPGVYRGRVGGSIARQLMEMVGLRDRLPADFDFDLPKSNESIGGLGLLAARHLWQAMGRHVPHGETRVRSRLREILIAECAVMKDRPFNGFTPDERAATEERFAPVLEALRPDLPEDHFPALLSPSSPADYVSPLRMQDATDDERLELGALFDRVCSRAGSNPMLSQRLVQEFWHALADLGP